MASRKSPLLNTASTLGKIVAFFAASAVAGVLVAGTLVPLAIGTSTATTVAQDTYDSIDVPEENSPVAQPSYLLDRDGKQIAKFFKQNRKEVKLDKVSHWMQKAIIDIEDERFYEHGGVDARGIARALYNNISGGGRQGASTITQQYVANLNVNDQVAAGLDPDQVARSGNKNVSDKVLEIKWANEIETKMSKDEILEGYLNLVPFAGATYGIEAASQRWFSKPASKLNLSEAALLAGMVQRPTLFNPAVNPEESTKRRNVVLGTMLKNEDITQKQYDKAVKAKISLKQSQEESGCEQAGDSAYFCSYVFNTISQDKTFGKTVQERQNLLYTGGLKIKTTLDSRLQKVAAKEVANTVPVGDKGGTHDGNGAGSTLVTRNNKTGEVLAMAQNTKFGENKAKNNIYTQVNYNTTRFQGGSTAKPWTAVAWLEDGKSLGNTVNATRKDYSSAKWKASCLPGGQASSPGWTVNNATAGTNNVMAASAGLFWSINTATVAEAHQLDLCDIFEVPKRLGLLDGSDTTVKDMAANPANLIGSTNVSPLAQSRAFGAFANEGKLCGTTPLLKVTGPKGEIKLPKTSCKQVIDADVVKKLNGTLKHIAGDRVAPGIAADIAGKTGTNNGATSTWFAGYTSDITTIAWVGRKDGKMTDPTANAQRPANERIYGLNNGLTVNGVARGDADSSTYASPLWKRYMTQILDYYPHESIPSEGPFSRSLKGGGTSSAEGASAGTTGTTGTARTTTGRTTGYATTGGTSNGGTKAGDAKKEAANGSETKGGATKTEAAKSEASKGEVTNSGNAKAGGNDSGAATKESAPKPTKAAAPKATKETAPKKEAPKNEGNGDGD
ncbi:MAG: transglycosylase domain-containing protein [Galactobacter sp.]